MTDAATAIQTSNPGRKLPARRMSFGESVQGRPRRAQLKDDHRPDFHADDSDTTASVEFRRATPFGEDGTPKDRLNGAEA